MMLGVEFLSAFSQELSNLLFNVLTGGLFS
jgi:hypothetical protein